MTMRRFKWRREGNGIGHSCGSSTRSKGLFFDKIPQCSDNYMWSIYRATRVCVVCEEAVCLVCKWRLEWRHLASWPACCVSNSCMVKTVLGFILLKPCIVLIIEYHKSTTCTIYYALKCSNYTPTCFEPSFGSCSGRVTMSQITHTHPTVWSQDLVTVVCNTPVKLIKWR
jgi:hypothetical protein